jgi:hypothetical protein
MTTYQLARCPIFVKATIIVMVTTLLSGCAGLGFDGFGADGLVVSTAPAELTAPAASAVAGDLVPRLAEQLGQGKATVILKPDSSVFGSVLEASLRTWGFAVTTDPDAKDKNAIHLAYVLAPVDGQILARLTTGSLEIGRIYATTGSGATPASPISVMQRG